MDHYFIETPDCVTLITFSTYQLIYTLLDQLGVHYELKHKKSLLPGSRTYHTILLDPSTEALLNNLY